MYRWLLAAYNSLTDKHLVGYFNNTRIRRHLLRSGLITRSGRILSEKEYKLNIMKRDHQKYIRECLAQAIFHKVLDMERYHQLEIKRKLEALARKERIQQFKGEHTRKFVENNMPVLSPHPPTGPKTSRGHSILIDERYSSPLTPTAPRPYTAPGNMQPPIRLQPLPSNRAVRTVSKRTLRSRSKTSLLENEVQFPIGGKKSVLKFRNSMDLSQRIYPYQLPYIENYLRSIPPPSPPLNGKIPRENRSETWRKRRFRPTTAPNGLEPLFTREPGRINKPSLHSNALITMIYLGKSVHLSYGDTDFQDEIKIYQQHCGGENLCVYTGTVLEKETFQFISKRHHGFPFSLTFFLNGMQVNRLSSCCEYKHRKGSRLGGKRGYFGFVCVEKASPCYKCIIAMGLDRKLPSAKLRKEKHNEKREGKQRQERVTMTSRRDEDEGSQTCVPTIYSAQEISTGLPEVRSAMEEMEQKCSSGQDVWEDDQENVPKYEYEEDFEGDEEQQAEKANKGGQADDQMNGISNSSSDDEKDHLEPEKENKILLQKAPEAEDNVKDEDDGYSESEWEEEKKDIKTSSSASSLSHPLSSESEDESAEHDQRVHTPNQRGYESSDEAASSSSSELSENDEPGKCYLPSLENFLEVEVKDQEIINTNVKTQALTTEESYENGLEEEMEKRDEGLIENLSKKSRKQASEKQKAKVPSKVWDETTAEVDRKAGLPEVDEGVGQMISEALAPACQCHSDTKSGVSSIDDGEKSTRKLESDPTGAPKKNLVVAERETVDPNMEAKQITPDMHAQRMEEATEKCEASQSEEEAGPAEEKENAALWEKAGVNEDSLEDQNPRAVQSALAEQFALGLASEAEAEAGDKNPSMQELNSTATASASTSETLNEDEFDEEQASVQLVLESEGADSEGSEKATFTRNLALSSEHLQEEAALGERVTLEMGEAQREEAESEAGVDERNVEVPPQSEDVRSVEDTDRVSVESSFEYAMFGGEEPVRERKEELETETPLSTSTGEINTWEMDISESIPEELNREGTAKQELRTEAESSREDDRQEVFPEELEVGRERKATQPNTPQWETRSEREEVTRANALKDEDTLEDEQKLKEEDKATVQGVRSEEEKKACQNEMESHMEEAGSTEGAELTGDTGRLEDPLKERRETMVKATCGFESLREQVIILSKDRGERWSKARDTEHKDRTELLGQNVILSEQEKEAHHGERELATPESEPAGKGQAPRLTTAATGEAEECAAKDQDGIERLERRDEKGTVQEHKGQNWEVKKTIQEDIPKGSPKMAGKFGGEAVDEVFRNSKCILGTGVRKESNVKRSDTMTEGAIVMDANQDQEVAKTATEKRGVLAASKTVEGETVANKPSSFSDVAGEEHWQAGKEALGKTAAVERVVTEEITLRSKEVPTGEEVTVVSSADMGVFLPHPEANALNEQTLSQGQDQERVDTQHTGSMGEEGKMKSPYEEKESGSPEEARKGSSSERKAKQNIVRLGAVAASSLKPDFPGIQEKKGNTKQEEIDSADIS
ncbi:glutamate-rich protein 3 [Perognathus longimembris pacificus]|uniref:glutamate-rich protein 3 n=1 Tax=Perognathus longimembris pacificus TaxID=214514 RepID=UPI002018EC18|nr:glutamate-rich protein 3 [Perognathus longimembris pacificus]